MLQDLTFKGVLSSDEDDILNEFYVPAFINSTLYRRSVGYFSAATISYAAQALTVFVQAGGKIQLVAGAFISQDEMDAVQKGYSSLQLLDRLSGQFIQEFALLDSEIFKCRLRALGWLVANKKLEIKIALRKSGIFHEKVGILTDANNDSIVFSGSANETAQALLPQYNFESMNIFPTWRAELRDHWEPHIRKFERLWNNAAKDTAVIPFPDAAREALIAITGAEPPPTLALEQSLWDRFKGNVSAEVPLEASIPSTLNGARFELRSHQLESLRRWKANDLNGILALATGAGKTVTAIYGLVQIARAAKGLFAIIAVPYQNLADQWCEVLGSFNILPIRCYISTELWSDRLNEAVTDHIMGAATLTVVVVVNRTLISPAFQSRIRKVEPRKLLFIGDECHHHGAGSVNSALPPARFRLGLSATPEHYLNDERNSNLERYYGQVVHAYGLKEAVAEGILTPYDYHIRLVELTESEATEYVELSRKISQKFASGGAAGGLDDDVVLQGLLRKRARLVGSAKNKIGALREVLETFAEPHYHSLFYCGDGEVEVDDAEGLQTTDRQIEVVSQELARFGWSNSHFTADESISERYRILRNFKEKNTHSLVAIRCLDEGIDIPACELAFILASQRDPRQFIQRRGRILRRAPGKEFAVIFDFIVMLPDTAGTDDLSKRLLEAELARVAEFCGLARNRHETYIALRTVLKRHSLEHII
jgi:superfamily II DNA or RNA helicase